MRMASLLLAVALFAAIVAGASAQAVCDPADQTSLLEFKAQLDDPEGGLAAWTADSDCCTWLQEVVCDGNGRVIGLYLSMGFSRFDIPEGYQLKVKQGIQGAGAPLGRLRELTDLAIDRVAFGFAHPIPPQFSTFVKPTDLSLLECEFIEEIPASIGNLVQLNRLIIQRNRLCGPAIPDTFGNLKSLTTLSLANNGLTSLGSQKLTLLKNLQTVNLSDNKFSGAIPAWLGRLTLTSAFSATLSLSGNPFTGATPDELCNIRGLLNLYIANTGVTAIPARIGNCRSLKVLHLVNNKPRGRLPSGLGLLRNLQTLAIGSDNKNFNRMSGALLRALCNLPELKEFDIANNDFSGRSPDTYGPFLTVRVPEESTRFCGNNLSGKIPVHLRDVPVDRFRPGNEDLCGFPLEACT